MNYISELLGRWWWQSILVAFLIPYLLYVANQKGLFDESDSDRDMRLLEQYEGVLEEINNALFELGAPYAEFDVDRWREISRNLENQQLPRELRLEHGDLVHALDEYVILGDIANSWLDTAYGRYFSITIPTNPGSAVSCSHAGQNVLEKERLFEENGLDYPSIQTMIADFSCVRFEDAEKWLRRELINIDLMLDRQQRN